MLALLIAIVVGVAIAANGNATLLSAADYLAPIGSLWVNAIRMTVIPLVVSLVIASDSAATRQLPPGAAEAAGQIVATAEAQTFATWVTSLIPTNPIAAAANGAMVPLILFTIFLALAIAKSPPAASTTLVNFFQAVADAMLVLVRGVISLAPLGVFALIVPIAARAGGELAGAIGLYIVAYSIAGVVVSLLLYPVVALFAGIPVRRFARAVLPAQLIAFSSSSSIASLPAMVESAETGLGLDPRVTGFVLPLAVSTFKFAGPLAWTVGTLFVSWFFHVPLGAREFAIVAFAAVFLSFAAPGVPGGAFIMLTPLFLAIGLPAAGVALLLAVDAIPDRFSTVLNVTGDLAATALVARTPAPDAG